MTSPAFTIFRSRDTVKALYFDGSLESALAILDAFAYSVQMELDGARKPTLRANSMVLREHVWLYKTENGLIAARDHEELTKRWEPLEASPSSKGKADGTEVHKKRVQPTSKRRQRA